MIKHGHTPTELLQALKQGPAKHVKYNAYAYRRTIDAELTRVGRIRDLQQRTVALAGTAIVAAFVSAGNVVGRLYYDLLKSDSNMAAVAAGAMVGGVLLTFIIFTTCVRAMRG